MEDFEKLGAFYLGRAYDFEQKKPQEELVLYDSKDLVTHAVCVGMTGSGKTGLCLDLIEEAAIDGIPAILIDPKGDLANLLLTFPDLKPEDFQPWINEDDARKAGSTPEQFAASQAELWKNGLAKWGQDGARIKRLRDAAEFLIYTPGSTAGLPVSILASFAAPPREIAEDSELLSDRVVTTATSLLGLLGISADPLTSREHILLSALLNNAWSKGTDLDLVTLIQQIQTPPMTKVGAFDMESFYPSKERFTLSLAINNLLAAPGFSSWLEGAPLDIGQILHTAQGKPRIAIFSIAHLSDAERMFFVSLLLTQILGWMRTQSGTTSLRSILYMDEIFGYFPPVANPPSKRPLLTLLKQARAYGLGVVLATQNPVDLDYKGLANIGTWFIGRLQTERDKARIMEGLEGAAAATGGSFDAGELEKTLSGLGSRIFLLNNTHEDGPITFESRWALSYLRGPLTRNQIKQLMDPVKGSVAAPQASASPAIAAAPVAAPAAVPSAPAQPVAQTTRPLLSNTIAQCFVPVRGSQPAGASLIYMPAVLGAAQINFLDAKTGIDMTNDVISVSAITSDPVPVNWDNSKPLELDTADLGSEPEDSAAQFADLPPPGTKEKSFAAWGKDFATWVYRTQELSLMRSSVSKTTSKPSEAERDFRIRLQLETREARDAVVEALRKKYAPKIAALEERRRRAEQQVQAQAEQAKSAKLQTAISFGSALIGSLFGRKVASMANVGRATTAARGVSRSMKESSDVARAGETVEAINQQITEMNSEVESATQELIAQQDTSTEQLEPVSVKPKKKDISVRLVSLAWLPYWRDSNGENVPAWE
jgi:hypothetical protein